jgi:hypothetical protein
VEWTQFSAAGGAGPHTLVPFLPGRRFSSGWRASVCRVRKGVRGQNELAVQRIIFPWATIQLIFPWRVMSAKQLPLSVGLPALHHHPLPVTFPPPSGEGKGGGGGDRRGVAGKRTGVRGVSRGSGDFCERLV